MIYARHNIIVYSFFRLLTRCKIMQNFHSVTLKGSFSETGEPILVIANHVSWWDGFWVMFLNMMLMNRKFHFMMLEKQLDKNWCLRHTGGFSIKKNSKSVIESLDYCVELLQKPENMVLMFPQGIINSIYNDELTFEKGVNRVVKQLSDNTQVLFVANCIDYLSNKKPNLFIYFQTFTASELKHGDIQQEYNRFYARSVQQQKTTMS